MKNKFLPALLKVSLLFITAASTAHASLSVWNINDVTDVTGSFTVSGNTVTATNSGIVFQDKNQAFSISGGPINPATSLIFTQGTISTQGNGEVITFTTTTNDNGKTQTDKLELSFKGTIYNQGIGPITLTDASVIETDPKSNNRNSSNTPTATIDLLMTAYNQGEHCETTILSNITDPVSLPEPSSIALLALGLMAVSVGRNKTKANITA